MAANNSVIIKGEGIREEFKAGGTITPGMLCEINSSGNIIVHNSADADAYLLFAVEDDLVGNDIDDDYVSGVRVQADWCHQGMMVNARLANGATAVIGNFLTSNGDGYLKVHVVDVEVSSPSGAGTLAVYGRQIVGVCREAVDMSGSSGADPSGRMLVSLL